MMRIYVTVDGDVFWGPLDRDLAWEKIQSGEIPKSAKWIEDRGQSSVGLRSQFAFFRPLGDIWGDKLDEVPDDLTPPVSAEIPFGLQTAPASPASTVPPGVVLLSFLGGLWLCLTLVGAVMIVWQHGDLGTGYGYEMNVMAWALAIAGALQGFLVFAVCRVLADVRVRLEQMVEAK